MTKTSGKYHQVVRIVRISPPASLKNVDPIKVEALKTHIILLSLRLTEIEEKDVIELEDTKSQEQLRTEMKHTNHLLNIAEQSFSDVLLVLSVNHIPEFADRIQACSRLVPIDYLYDRNYYGSDLKKALSETNAFNKTICNVYQFNDEIGTYQDLNCGGIYAQENVFTFVYQETPESEPTLARFVRRTKRDSEEPLYYAVLDDGNIVNTGTIAIIDNPQYELESMRGETLRNTGSILCYRESGSYFKILVGGDKGERIEFHEIDIREKLRTPFNSGQVL